MIVQGQIDLVLLGETFDLRTFFTQDRANSVLQLTVFDADSDFDQASVPQGRYVLSLTQFTDLAGNPRIFGPHVDMGAYEYLVPVYLPLVVRRD